MHLVAALDDWSHARDELLPKSGWATRRVANLADADLWRQQLRGAIERGDKAALERLAKEARKLGQPPRSVLLLCFHLGTAGRWADVENLLRPVQQAHQ